MRHKYLGTDNTRFIVARKHALIWPIIYQPCITCICHCIVCKKNKQGKHKSNTMLHAWLHVRKQNLHKYKLLLCWIVNAHTLLSFLDSQGYLPIHSNQIDNILQTESCQERVISWQPIQNIFDSPILSNKIVVFW